MVAYKMNVTLNQRHLYNYSMTSDKIIKMVGRQKFPRSDTENNWMNVSENQFSWREERLKWEPLKTRDHLTGEDWSVIIWIEISHFRNWSLSTNTRHSKNEKKYGKCASKTFFYIHPPSSKISRMTFTILRNFAMCTVCDGLWYSKAKNRGNNPRRKAQNLRKALLLQ